MAKTFELSADAREGTGKGAARAVRREGGIPAVVYGGSDAPVAITLQENELMREYLTGNFFTQICELKVGNDTHKVLGRDVQLHPVSDRPLHVDFLRVTDKTRINVSVSVNFVNEDAAPGISNEGGTLSVVRFEVEVVCRAIAIPDELVIDLTDGQIGDTFTSSNIDLPDGVEFAISDRDFAIASINAPKAVEVEEEDEDGEGVEGEEGAEGGEAAEGGSEAEEKAEGGDE